ncbi:hypothetical protein JVU11DRAFT_9249 [Chiua virens]|nr:hypothetical protein JVU11DRAFT_9249 [Chiua virens]
MDLNDLYWRIVEMFEDKRDPWVKETLSWWRRLSIPSKNGNKLLLMKNKDDDSDSDGMDVIRAHKAAREPEGRVSISTYS